MMRLGGGGAAGGGSAASPFASPEEALLQTPLSRDPVDTMRWRSSKAQAKEVATASAVADGKVVKEGFLVKKGHVLRTQKERYFVLRQHTLSYFRAKWGEKKGKPGMLPSSLKGVLELAATDIVTPAPHSDQWFRIQKLPDTDGKSYKLDLKAVRHGRDATILSARISTFPVLVETMLADDAKAASIADLRASFMILHELVLLQRLVETIKASWGAPAQWTCEQYQELVQSIGLAQEKAGAPLVENNSILAEAFQLRYAFEEVAENQPKLRQIQEAQQAASDTAVLGSPDPTTREASTSVVLPPAAPRLRCPTIYGYYSTFEQLSIATAGEASPRGSISNRASSGTLPLTPRSATIAKYAHLYLEDDVRTRKPWSWDRTDGDDLLDGDSDDALEGPPDLQRVVERLCERFTKDRIYTTISDHTMVLFNPHRILQTSKFTSIYDEQVVLTYAMTPSAMTQLAPHPFVMAKHALLRVFYAHGGAPLSRAPTPPTQTILLSGESGSGKTELAKELLKYFVLSARPTSLDAHGSRPRVKLFTSSTKSTTQMRTEETRTMALLEAKGVERYEIVLLDLYPERWAEMTSVSRSKRIPQVHVDGLFFGFYDKLESLEDEEQLRMYFKNPHAARKLSTVLDANILLEAFGNATTPMNANSSRFGKTTTLYFAFERHPSEYQIVGCRLDPFLLEKSRVTSARGGATSADPAAPLDTNFHVFYALVAGVNAVPFMRLLAKDLCLDGMTSETFAFLGKRKHKLHGAWTEDETWKKDVERWQHVLDALSSMDLGAEEQRALFQVLSAILWLGNIDFEWDAAANKLQMMSPPDCSAARNVVELLGLDSIECLEGLLFTKHIALASTGESFDVVLEKGQVAHRRDTLARLLYQVAFSYLVAQMNAATRVDSPALGADASGSLRALKIVDVFGFENLRRNSLEQLCINYLSEKLFAAEQHVVAARYCHSRVDAVPPTSRAAAVTNDSEDDSVLFLFEYPLGVFASLEELTVLHQGENDSAQQERKKNQLLVRNLYERNASRLLEPPRTGAVNGLGSKDALPFTVPHARESVTYDAAEFVNKNSDFEHASLLDGLETVSSSVHLRSMVAAAKSASSISTALRKPRGAGAGAGSLVTQFRTQIHTLTTPESDGSAPLYMHCIRPNSSGRPASVDAAIVEAQLRSHRVLSQIELGRATRGESPAASYYSVEMPSRVFVDRYRCLLPRRVVSASDGIVYDKDIELSVQELLSTSDAQLDSAPARAVVVTPDAIVRFPSAEMVERLDLLLEVRQIQAAVAIQSLARMVAHRRAFVTKQKARTSLKSELVELYGPGHAAKVEKILSKYASKESELRAKIVLKKRALHQEHAALELLAQDLRDLCLSSDGGLRADTVDELLADASICVQLQQSESIVAALRDMSLNPQVLTTQLADPVLRTFYESLVAVLKDKRSQAPITSPALMQLPLEERVQRLVVSGSESWKAAASSDDWSEYRATLDEIGDDPELLVFHTEDPDFVTVLESFVARLETQQARDEQKAAAAAQCRAEAVDTQASAAEVEADMLEMLLMVELDERLMAAMRHDSFFVQALENPVLITSMQQFTANREGFASLGGLQNPITRDFFLRLIKLSLGLQEQES